MSEHVKQFQSEMLNNMADALTAAQSRAEAYVEHIKRLQAEIEQLRALKFCRFNNEDCWIYQGDGEDHLESLVCPVVMSAQQVMEFEKAQSRVAELEREVERLRSVLSKWESFPAYFTGAGELREETRKVLYQ